MNTFGTVGDGTTTDRLKPTLVTMPPGVTFTTIAVGGWHACAFTTTSDVYCWGRNDTGQLGDGTITNSNIPVAVNMPSGVTFTSMSLGFNDSCALDSSGKIYCWGKHDGVNNTLAPTWVSSYNLLASSSITVNYTSLTQAHSRYHKCALDATGNAYCWGRNIEGQLGNGTTTDSAQPVAVNMPAGITFTSIDVGNFHTCAIGVNASAAKSIWCWGESTLGQLGYGTYNGNPFETLPRQVQLSHITNLGFNIQKIEMGASFSCAIFQVEGMYCWGENTYGTHGNGTTNDSDIAVAVSVPAGVRFSQLSSNIMHTCALSTNNDVYCWGKNYNGRLGDNTTTARLTPVKVVYP
jgi:alpha-tubulin suppressor-like RCC1 family protein